MADDEPARSADGACPDCGSILVADLRQKVENLRWQLTVAREAAERRNRDLDALHLVWCDGGCPSGVHRHQSAEVLVTEELVAAAERNTKRLRRWYEAVKFRHETYATASGWHRQYAARAAAKTDLGAEVAAGER